MGVGSRHIPSPFLNQVCGSNGPIHSNNKALKGRTLSGSGTSPCCKVLWHSAKSLNMTVSRDTVTGQETGTVKRTTVTSNVVPNVGAALHTQGQESASSRSWLPLFARSRCRRCRCPPHSWGTAGSCAPVETASPPTTPPCPGWRTTENLVTGQHRETSAEVHAQEHTSCVVPVGPLPPRFSRNRGEHLGHDRLVGRHHSQQGTWGPCQLT